MLLIKYNVELSLIIDDMLPLLIVYNTTFKIQNFKNLSRDNLKYKLVNDDTLRLMKY